MKTIGGGGMARNQSTAGWLFGGIFATAFALVRSVALLVLELVAAMLLYVYLNIYHQDLFGYLVRLSGEIFQSLSNAIILPLFADTANQAYSSVLGEMSPKAVLLVLISLTVGAFVRFVVWIIKSLIAAGRL
ncbi:MAG: hypothetical protein AAFR23_09100, partial [Pseudomonadota bacterium]